MDRKLFTTLCLFALLTALIALIGTIVAPLLPALGWAMIIAVLAALNLAFDLSDKATETQKELLNTKDALFQKEIWINKLEQTMPKEKIEQLKAEEKKEE